MTYAAVAIAVLTSPAPELKTKITVNESLRFETKTTSGAEGFSTWSQTEEAQRTKLTITVDMPLATTSPDGSTTFAAKIGGYEFTGKLSDDPTYKLGKSSVRLYQTVEAPGSRAIVSKIELRWTKDQLSAKILADSPSVSSVAAKTFVFGQVGKVEGLTDASIRFGSDEVKLQLPLTGKVGRRSASSGDVSGSATTVDLKGQVTSE